MPIYEYRCAACDYRFEIIQKFSDAPATRCPNCEQHQAARQLSAPAIQFKGSGWYITDYANKNSPAPSNSNSNQEKKDTSSKPTNKKDSPT